MEKYIINILEESLSVLGNQIDVGGHYLVPPSKQVEMQENAKLIDYIDNEKICVSYDSSTITSVEESHKIINLKYSADEIKIYNENNDFEAENVQEAIEELNEEVENGLVGFSFQMSFINTSRSSNRWLQLNDNNIQSYETFGICSFDCELVAITFSNKKEDVDWQVEVWVSSIGDGLTKTRVLVWAKNNSRIAYKTNFSPRIEFDKGDKIGIYLKDKGKNPKNTLVTLYFRVINNDVAEESENFDGSWSGGGTS